MREREMLRRKRRGGGEEKDKWEKGKEKES